MTKATEFIIAVVEATIWFPLYIAAMAGIIGGILYLATIIGLLGI